MLLVEYLAISLRFDAFQLLGSLGQGSILGLVGMLGPVAIAFGTAFWLLGGAQIRDALRDSMRAEDAPLWPRLAVHLLCFVGFFTVTSHLSAAEVPLGRRWVWLVAWAAGAVLTVLTIVPVAVQGLRLRPVLPKLALPLTLAGLLGVAAWGAGIATVELWEHLSEVTLAAVSRVLDLFTEPIVYDPQEAIVGTDRFWVIVSPVCSGYEGIGLVATFLAAYFVTFRERFRFPHALLVIPAAVFAVWFLNVVRIVALILVGDLWSPDVALGGFHSKAGWLLFCAVALAAVWASERTPWFVRDRAAPRVRMVNPSAPFLLPLLAIVGTALLTGLFVSDFDYFYPLRVLIALLVLAWYRKDYTTELRHQLAERPLWSWGAVGIGVVVYAIWVFSALPPGDGRPQGPPLALSEMSAPLAALWIVARVLGSVITVPIAEELAFRGFLLRRLIASDFTSVPYDKVTWPSLLISSIAFALVHQLWLAGFFAGVLFACAQLRRGLLSDAILAHAVANALIAAHVLLGGAWWLW